MASRTVAERSLPITEPTLEVTRFATALAGVAQDALRQRAWAQGA